MAIRSEIIGCGSYLPERIVSNSELAKTVDTSDEWIVTRTGIQQRHIADDNEKTSDLAYKAGLKALEHAGMDASDLDLVIVATTTPDNTFPATATKVQAKLGMTKGLHSIFRPFVRDLSSAYPRRTHLSKLEMQNISCSLGLRPSQEF